MCAGSCGPGNLHLINGLYDANRSHAPVLAIASHIPSPQIGMGFFQETHPDRLFVECSVYKARLGARSDPRVFDSAIRHATTLKGVSVVTLPGDVADEEANVPTPRFVKTAEPAVYAAQVVQQFADLVNSAGKVAIFAWLARRQGRA